MFFFKFFRDYKKNMSCNGFTIKLPIEDLILNLDKKYILSSNIAKYLTIFQLNGVRYLYKNYEKVI